MTKRPGHRHGWAVLTGAALLALVAAAAPASTPTAGRASAKAKRVAPAKPATVARIATPPAPPAAAPSPAPATGSFGLMAFLDPETGMLTGPIGDLVPPADQRAASANVLLTPVQRPNGAWLLDLKGTMMEHYIMQIDPLGNRRVVCVQDPRQVRVLPPLAPMTPAPAGEER